MKPIESWKNPEFLGSPDARILRIISEYLEPQARFKKFGVDNTIMFWGSARILPPEKAKENLEQVKSEKGDVALAERKVELSKYYADAERLAAMVTKWSKGLGEGNKQFVVATGGGAVGIMEAANKGASEAGGKSVGLGVTLPFEDKLNNYITRELALQFHYFFMRKFWMVYLAKALIAFPGGWGTFDELFEVLTLIQTGKPKKVMPVVLYGSKYWKEVINMDAMAKWGLISPKDLQLFKICDTPEEAFEYVTSRLTEMYIKDEQ